MKKITSIFGTILAVLLVALACDTQDLNEFSDDLILKKGKPVKDAGSDYDLADTDTPLQVYGVWHAGNDYCTWGQVRDTAGEFDDANNWIIDRGDGEPSVNLVVLSFVNPLDLLHGTSKWDTLGGIPVGMNQEVVDYFKNADIRVMLSIGGITYTDDWNAALAENASQLGENAAMVAQKLGVGIEIDYEENTDPNIDGLQAFINAYRGVHPYDANGENHAARLTIDLAAGDRWLIALCQYATENWLTTDDPVLDYANAMVPARQPSLSSAMDNWYEHVVGKPQYVPAILPLAPCKFTGGLYITDRKKIAECVDFNSSLQYQTRDFVRRVNSQIEGLSSGMLGYMFWAAECPGTRIECATDCTLGVGAGASEFDIPIPMPALREN